MKRQKLSSHQVETREQSNFYSSCIKTVEITMALIKRVVLAKNLFNVVSQKIKETIIFFFSLDPFISDLGGHFERIR